MPGLVVEEEVGFEFAQELALRESAEEHRLVDADVPRHQRADRALVRRRAARRDERRAHPHRRRPRLLQPMQRREEGLERTFAQWLQRVTELVLLERSEPLLLE